jgi:hypothetical protein
MTAKLEKEVNEILFTITKKALFLNSKLPV